MPKKNKGQNKVYGKGVVQLYNCSGFQVGLDNDMTIKDASSGSTKSVADLSAGANETGVLIVRNILNGYPQGITLTDLRMCIKEQIKESKAKTFAEITGRNVEDFLHYNKQIFEIKGRPAHRIVKNKGSNKTRNTGGTTSVEDKQSADTSNTKGNDDVSSRDTFGNDGRIHVTGDRISQTLEVSQTTQLDNDMWIEVKKKQRHQLLLSGKSIEEENIDGKTLEFLHTIHKSKGSDIIFIEDSIEYIESPTKCMFDIGCLWNTPYTQKSHIIIGIARNECGTILQGVSEKFGEEYWQQLFSENLFTMTPMFKHFEISHDSKLFYMIEISCSSGHGQPCIVKKDLQIDGNQLSKNDLWYRKNANNTICEPTDTFTGCIYQWFLSPRPSPMPNENLRAGENMLYAKSLESQGAIPKRQNDDNIRGPISSSSFNSFWKTVNGFEKGSFILVCGGISKKSDRNIHQLGILPWLAVYDFDVFSCSDGVLNVLQDVIENIRNLQILTWKDSSGTLSETGTLWCFMRGRKEISDSRTDNEEDAIENVYDWVKEVKVGLQEQCEKLASFSEDYSPITIVLCWPDNEETIPHMGKFLDKLADSLSYQPKIVILMESKPKTSPGRNRLEIFRDDFKENLHVVQMGMDTLLHGISNYFSRSKQDIARYDLPTEDDELNAPISQKEVFWLNEDFEVLYLSDPYLVADKEIDEKINNFFKGGSLPWSVWYKSGQDQVEIERDPFENMCSTINQYLDYKTNIIYLFHAPGSGGSTLAKRILWRFHDKFPCLHLKLGTINRHRDIVEKVGFVHQKTRLPILLLIDGEEETKVSYLCKTLPYTLILYVKRYPYKVQQVLPKNKIYLAGMVTSKEAKLLASRYGERCAETKREALDRLAKEVKKGQPHLLLEFGMTVFHHEFKGIRAYVKGYLQLHSNRTNDLQAWQKCVGYLSLVYYYGQTSVPCQMFAALFGKPSNYVMGLKDDFPHPIGEFVVNDTNDKRKDNIRICHYAVAKEILEQILTRNSRGSKEDISDQLSYQARRNLAGFCLEFIEYTSKRHKKTTLSTTTRLILARTFIFRDEKDMGENEEQKRRRPVLSKLMVDIPAGKPLFTERLQILEKLVSSFPDDPSFQAHLGRFYAFCRTDEEDQVEKYFTEAIRLCEKLQNGRHEDEVDDGTKSTLTHVYHMYGIVKHRYLSKYTARYQGHKADTERTEESFCTRIKELVDVAQLSCQYFAKSRQLTPETRDVYTYAYTGEIQVRIQVCDYVKRFFRRTAIEAENIFESFFVSKADDASKNFIRECISEIEILIHECYTDVELSNDDINSLRPLVSWYNELFKKQQITLEIDQTVEECERRRLEIAALKLRFAPTSSFGEIEKIAQDKEAIEEIVKLYDENISEALRRGCPDKVDKKNLERDCREWIFAIRHEDFSKQCSLEDVLLRVQKWHEMVRSPISTYYLFIIQSLIGFDTDKCHGKTECLVNARETREEMLKMRRLIIRPKYPREWLGNHTSGIRMLVSGNRHVGLGEGNGPDKTGLKICKGTIKHPNTNCVGGYIEYGMEISNVTVFFIPKRSELTGTRFAGRRVEFNLAFSIEHGYEAFNVKLLTRHGCPCCSRAVEFTSAETILVCSCGAEVQKDTMNEINLEQEKEGTKQS